MTTTPTPTQPPAAVPAALRLADKLNTLCVAEFAWPTLNEAAVRLRRYHARVAELEAEVEYLRAPAPAATQAEQPGAAVPRMTPEEINALPEKARDYIHQLVANADPAGMVRENMQLRDTNEGLQRMYRKAADALAAAHPPVAAPAPTTEQAGAPLPQGAEAVGADGWPKLTADAKTAGGTFGKGVSARLLVEACYRRAAMETERRARTPDATRDEERRRRALWEMVNGPLESAAPGGEAPDPATAAATDAPDPLQGAASWLVEAVEDCETGDIASRLLIGGNRAKRLYDAARAAQGQEGAA